MSNDRLREHVTNTAFNLTLTKRQMDFLILLHHYRGNFDRAHNHVAEGRKGKRENASHYLAPMWVANAHSLIDKGLLNPEPHNWSLTKAGNLVVSLLREADIYQDRLADLGLARIKAA